MMRLWAKDFPVDVFESRRGGIPQELLFVLYQRMRKC